MSHPPEPAAPPPPSPGVVRFRNAAGCLFGAAVLGVMLLFNGNYLGAGRGAGTLPGGDFLQEYVGGHVVRAGDRSRLYDPGYSFALEHDPAVVGFAFDPDRYLPMVYPPFYYLLVAPLSALSYTAATYVWFGLMAGAGAATAWLWRRAVPAAPQLLAWAVPAAAVYAPFLENVSSNQKATVVLLLFTATYYLLGRGRPFAAGVVFGLLAFKPQFVPVVVLAMAWKGQWRFLTGAAATAGVLLGLSLAVGVDACGQYVEFARTAGDYARTAGFPHHRAHGWRAFFHPLAPDSPGAVRALTLSADAATLVLLVPVMRGRFGADPRRLPLQFAALVAATVLVSPHLLAYDLTVLLLPMLLVLVEVRPGNPFLAGRSRWAIGGVAAFYVLSAVSTAIASATGVQVTSPLLFALVVGAARVLGRGRGT